MNLLIEENGVSALACNVMKNFSDNGDWSHEGQLADFFANTLIKNYNLWRFVLKNQREISIISRDGYFRHN